MGMSFKEKYGGGDKSTTETKALIKGDEPLTDEQALIKLVCNTVFRSVVVIFLTFGGCTMHSNIYDDDRLLAEAELATAKGEATVKKAEAELEQIKAIERLDKGLFPGSFCKIVQDVNNREDYCSIFHADGAGTKSSLAYMFFKETGDINIFRNVVIL